MLLSAFACAAIAIGIALCAMLATAAADEAAAPDANNPLAMAAADEPLITVPYPQGRTYTYDGTEKNAVSKVLTPTADGYTMPDSVSSVSAGFWNTAIISSMNDLYLCGSNATQTLNDGATHDNTVPNKVMPDVAQASLGGNHFAVLTTSGDLYTWGFNYAGQLGTGNTTKNFTPTKILSDVAQISTGQHHTAALTTTGDLYMWGDNEWGQVGNNSDKDCLSPVKVLDNVAQVVLCDAQSAAITTDGDLYMWGNNNAGELGDGTTLRYRATPVKILSNVKQVALGNSHTAAITESGELYMWGSNGNGQLGNGETAQYNVPPTKIEIPFEIAQISLGGNHSAAISTSGDLYMWGYNGFGQLGDGTQTQCATPKKIMSDVAEVSLSANQTAVVTNVGDLYTWGENRNGQLGNGTKENQSEPVKIDVPLSDSPIVRLYEQDSGDTVIATDAGDYHCYAVPCDGCCWPDGTTDPIEVTWTIAKATYDMSGVSFEDETILYDGALHSLEVQGELPEGVTVSYEGNGQTEPGTYTVTAHFTGDTKNHEPIPDKTVTMTISLEQTAFVQGKHFVYDGMEKNVAGAELVAVDGGFALRDGFVASAMGTYHGGALTSTGDLYMWGSNSMGQVGDGTTENRSAPVKVLSGVKQIALGGSHSAAVTESGDLYLWGYNGSGQIGDGTTTTHTSPVKVLSDVQQVALGGSHSAAVTESGDLYLWGGNNYGQLGDGTTENRSTPVKVLSGISQAALGRSHSAAISTTGELFMWGLNDRGQIGDNTTTNRLTPVSIFNGVTQVSLGYAHSAFITTSGLLCCWGLNSFGFVGDGTSYDRHYPVGILDDVAQVSLGDLHSSAVTKSGDLYMWGNNGQNQIDQSDTAHFYRPTKVRSDIAQAALGDDTTSAIDTSGKLFTWGYNYYGQLGNGTTSNRSAPTEIEGIVSSNLRVRFFEQDPGDAVYATDAGEYHCYAVPCDGYCWEDGTRGPVEVTWSIGKAVYNMYDVSFNDATFENDGSAHSIEVSGWLPWGVSVSYEGNGQSEPGSHTVTAHFAGDEKNFEPIPDMTATMTVDARPRWMRLGGQTRYDTMESIVKQAFPQSSEYAVLVSGKNFPDALSAASLAGAYSCPIVSTDPDGLSSQARRELERIGAKHVVIVGGPAAVSENAEAAVKGLSSVEQVERVYGQTRYDTSLAVMEKVKEVSGGQAPDTVFVTTGANFPDALSASPFSYASGTPILLVNPATGMTDAQAKAAVGTGARRAVLLGGDLAVPTSVEGKLKSFGMGEVKRLIGANRYHTAVLFAGWAAANGATLERPSVATGRNFADALVGAPLAGGKNSVLLLVDNESTAGSAGSLAVRFLADHASEVRGGYILGGESAVSKDLETRILQATNGIMAAQGSPLSGQTASSETADGHQFTAAQFG